MAYLDRFLDATRARVAETKQKVTEEQLEQRVAGIEPARSLKAALAGEGISLIGEIKRVSPAKGALDEHLDAAKLARAYAAGGAAAISVLTEPDHFKGSPEDLEAARAAGIPVLRKDFILDPFQVLEARALGADAVLIIVRALGTELGELVAATTVFGMEALVEVHDEDELERALAAGATLVGVNHRNLDTFEVDPDRTAKLAPRVPSGVTVVALSGVSTRAEMLALESAGAAAALVGESLVTAADPAAKIRELLGKE